MNINNLIDKDGYFSLVETVMTEDRLDKDFLRKTLNDKYVPGATQIAIVDQIITREDGTELFKPLGTNVTTIGGTQTIVENMYDNIDPASPIKTFKLETIDGSTGDALPTGWELNEVELENPTEPRKIFGFMLGTDGAIMTTVKPVARREKGFDLKNIIPFYKTHLRSDQDNMEARLNLGNRPVLSTPNYASSLSDYQIKLKHMISAGKYAGRFSIKEEGNEQSGYAGYLIKLLNFNVSNIMVDGTQLSNESKSQSLSLDVRTKVEMRIEAEESQLSAPASQADKKSIKTSTISSIMLVAGRRGHLKDNNNVKTYGDIIVTNKINFIELPVETINLRLRYTIYYV